MAYEAEKECLSDSDENKTCQVGDPVTIDAELCNGCDICANICPYAIFSKGEKERVPSVSRERVAACCQCGHCGAVCPAGAISLSCPCAGPLLEYSREPPVTAGQLMQHIAGRRSIRHYTQDKVPKDVLEQVFSLVRYAPTGMNRQTVHWRVIHDPSRVRQLAGAVIAWAKETQRSSPGHPLAPLFPVLTGAWDQGIDLVCHGAPHLIIAHGHRDDPAVCTDAVIALTHLDLAAPVFHLGTCWGGLVQIAFEASPDIAEMVGIPEDHHPLYAMMIGYPRYQYLRIPRRDMAKITWG